MNRAKIDVPGLSCPSCQVNVESLLSNINGVASVEADQFAGTVVVEFDPTLVAEDQLVNEIAKMKLCEPDL